MQEFYGAAARLKAEELVEPILIGSEEEIKDAAHARGIKTSSLRSLIRIITKSGMKWLQLLLNVEMERHPKNKQRAS